MYAIVDIETTGGSHQYEKITEIAIYVHDGEKIVDEFSTLINPEKNIPYFITELTGISNEMVAQSPKFYEVAKQIVQKTENCIFVGHNVNFDYHFVKEEFARLGYEYQRDVLCTVKLSRKLIPGKPSYSLGKLCSNLGITLNNRHRAAGDALATVKLFELLQDVNNGPLESHLKKKAKTVTIATNPLLNPDVIKQLPHKTGVYSFHDEKGNIIYIGRSADIYNRVNAHLHNTATKKAVAMVSKIADVGHELTGSELVALLLESYQIKKHQPLYNKAQRRASSQFGIYTYNDSAGYIRFFIDKNTFGMQNAPLVSFNALVEARQFLGLLVNKYQLCQKLSGLYESQGACFHYGIKECKGACMGEESPEIYNSRASQIIRNFEYDSENFWILDMGRNDSEYSLIRIKGGKYLGFGYLTKDIPIQNITEMEHLIKSYPDNQDTQQIIKNYLKNHPGLKIIRD
jgi:DNA polymerase III subunit epsilon